jgi:thioredoxin 1
MLENVTQSDFNQKVLQAKGLVIVDYWSPNCGPCEMYNTVLEQIIPELPTDTKIYKMNVDEEILLANQEGILVMPTTKIYKNGDCIKDILGVQTKDDLRAVLENLS